MLMYEEVPAPREDVVDVYHKTEVCDPYRWLEDPDSEATKRFVDEQNKLTRPYLDEYQDKYRLAYRLRSMWDYPRYSCPFKHGDKYFYYKNLGLQNQSILYSQDVLAGISSIFLDPNNLSRDGTISLSGTKFSEDGKIFAYGLSSSGSDWISIHFKHVNLGNYDDVLLKVKFSSIAWTHDNKGIFYGCYPDQIGKADGSETDQNHNQKLYYHLVGTDQCEDILVAEFPEEPEFRIGAEVSDDGRWLILSPVKGCKNNLVYYGDLSCIRDITGKIPLVPMVTELNADYEYVTSITTTLVVFRTNRNAPNYRLIIVDLKSPAEDQWATLIDEHARDVLDWVSPIHNDVLAVCYIRDVKSVLNMHVLTTGQFICNFPLEIGTITGFTGKKTDSQCFFMFTSFLNPGVIYQIDLSKQPLVAEVFMEIEVPTFNPKMFECSQVFYDSKDGTTIPMFLVSRKGAVNNSQRPCLLYGYGGFNVSIQPTFSLTRIVFIESFDGLLAIPNVRGGGEYGENWHNGGRFFNKQNVFDDFQYAAKYLIQNGYTHNSKLAIQGGSNGGLLVGACINQAPELFRTAVAQVGVMDMLRFHKFTIGYAWTSDYGCSDNEEHFYNLLAYSPLHNVQPRDVQYPATLLLTADHDDRVVPLHSLKFIAELQHKLGDLPQQQNPLLIRVETNAGHGRGKPTNKIIDEAVDILSFIGRSLDLKYIQSDSHDPKDDSKVPVTEED